MAPRQPKPKADDASCTPSPLRPKTEKAKVEKTKTDKPKAEKAVKADKVKTEKVTKPKAVKAAALTTATATEKEEKEEKPKVEKVVKKDKVGVDGKPEKEKVKAVNGDEAVELIARYLKEQNRPYSATEVSANLHGKVTKTVADKLMKEMAEKGDIMAKATNGDKKGSQWVFWALQDPSDTASPEELAGMETTITTLRETMPSLKSHFKNLNTKLNTLKSAPTTSELVATIESLRQQNAAKTEKLKGFESGSVKMVTREEMEKVEKDFKYWVGKRKVRKAAFLNLEAQLLEGMGREEIWEKVGIEEDTYQG